MKTAIYIRTSTEDQNPENQLNDCRSINEWPSNTEVFRDQQSAWKDNVERPQFENLQKDIKKGRIGHLIVWDLDRLYRNRKKLIAFFKNAKMYGVRIHSFRQGWLEKLHKMPEPFDEAMHDFMLHIMGWMAEDESRKKSERVKAAIRKKGDVTVSYKGNKWGRKSISPQKRRKILELRDQGLSIRQIKKEINVSIGTIHRVIT